MKLFDGGPLVSIVVITFNSAQFIVETLESAKNQSYQNIELIISDDGSIDETIKICNDWLNNNHARFVRFELITSSHNTGIACNLNRGIKASKGEWIKSIAGDDILLPNCISVNMDYVNANPEAVIVFSNMIHFTKEYTENNYLTISDSLRKKLDKFFSLSTEKQLHIIINCNYLPAPTVFQKRCIIESVGYYDEKYGYEDWPMWIILLEKGIPLSYFDKNTIAYRHHVDGLSTHEGVLFNIKHQRWKYAIRKDLCFKHYSKLRQSVENSEYYVHEKIYAKGWHTDMYMHRILYLTIIHWYSLLKLLIGSNPQSA